MAADWIGWVATAAFASSYFCREGRSLRAVQGGAAMLWIGYGIFIRATPVIVANVIVAAAAGYSLWKSPR